MECVDDSEGPLDPRIQVELENLNSATEDINKLEIELDEANTRYKKVLSESSRRIEEIKEKIGSSCIEKAKHYYEALEDARRAQAQCQHQAHLFQRASEIHAAAKETAALAEARFISHKDEWNFDQTWQDVLNHATTQVMDAENKKAECDREHRRKAVLSQNAEIKVQQLREKYNRSIIKARPYFEARAVMLNELATQKERVECLQKAVKDVKQSYARSFHVLEEISDQIHQKRKSFEMIANGPREPGVGAELMSPEGNSQLENISNRLVDGSEAVLSQSEIELQASLEKLGNLSSEMSRLAVDQENLNSGVSDADEYRIDLESTSSPTNSSSIDNYSNSRGIALENKQLNEDSCTKYKFRELPLLSIVQGRNSLQKFNGKKSYSMINLTEIHNLRSSLNASLLQNMQTISSERLANARSVLLETQIAKDKE